MHCAKHASSIAALDASGLDWAQHGAIRHTHKQYITSSHILIASSNDLQPSCAPGAGCSSSIGPAPRRQMPANGTVCKIACVDAGPGLVYDAPDDAESIWLAPWNTFTTSRSRLCRALEKKQQLTDCLGLCSVQARC